MPLQNKLLKIRDVLTSISGLPVSHYEYNGDSEFYCVWAEDNEPTSVEGDNKKQIQTIQGTIDFFTKMEFDPFVDEIQCALNDAEISFRLNSVQYEDETELIHFEWVWEE